MTGGGLLVTETGGQALELWDVRVARSILTIDPPGLVTTWWLRDDRLIGVSDDGLLRIDLDPGRVLGALCAAHDRPYTDAERALLPPGTDAGKRPCHLR